MDKMSGAANKAVKLQLYKTVLQKARKASSGYHHLFRFQNDCDPKAWGTGRMYSLDEDRQMLESIFPKSAHHMIDNDYQTLPEIREAQTNLDRRMEQARLAAIGKGGTSESKALMREVLGSGVGSTKNKSHLFKRYLATKPPNTMGEWEKLREARKAAKTDEVQRRAFLHNHMNPIPIQTVPTPVTSVLSEHMSRMEYGYPRMAAVIRRAFKERMDLSHNNNNDNDDWNESELLNQAFEFCRELDKQIALNECTSVAEASGMRVIVTAKHVPSMDRVIKTDDLYVAGIGSASTMSGPKMTIADNPSKKMYAFTYRIRIENHSRRWNQLLGRHWIIRDSNGLQQEVEKYQPGVVGLSPQLYPGQVFVYSSGVYLQTPTGMMRGAYQFNSESHELFEVPVAPFKLIANQQESED